MPNVFPKNKTEEIFVFFSPVQNKNSKVNEINPFQDQHIFSWNKSEGESIKNVFIKNSIRSFPEFLCNLFHNIFLLLLNKNSKKEHLPKLPKRSTI